jgi:hypothetical protein
MKSIKKQGELDIFKNLFQERAETSTTKRGNTKIQA